MNILIVAGEASGDAHAGSLVAAIKQFRPDIAIWGTGGTALRSQDVELLCDASKMNVVGFLEVVKHYSFLRSILNSIISQAILRRPSLVILVDYPGFNLRLAKALHRLGFRIVYYIAPQVWAWKEQRVETLRRCVDELIVVFPFEVNYFKEQGITAHYFGHPLAKPATMIPKKVRGDSKRTVVYLPGSRPDEIRRHMPVILRVIDLLGDGFTHVIVRAGTLDPGLISAYSDDASRFLVSDDAGSAFASADVALVKSGTSTVEAALAGVPFAVIYKTSRLSFMIARRMIRVPFIAMVNILAGREIVREFVQSSATPESVASELRRLLDDQAYRSSVALALDEVRRGLQGTGAAAGAAEFILNMVKE